MKPILHGLSLLTLLLTAPAFAAEAVCTTNCHPFYVGVSGGYGSTTWYGLVPDKKHQNDAMTLSTPISTREGGAVWGFLMGYEVLPYLAIEAFYMRYPDATLYFNTDSIYYLDTNQTTLTSSTETAGVVAKILMLIPHTQIRAFSGAGAAVIHRWDKLNEARRTSPTFVIGANYNITPHLMMELTGSYTAGFGVSELQPANDYMPFLYAGYLTLAYKI